MVFGLAVLVAMLLGYWGPSMRIGARPEVTVIELARA